MALDASEGLGYVGLGGHGVAIVDLTGPASIQPIDFNRNGVDDRVLGLLETAGAAGRVALDSDAASVSSRMATWASRWRSWFRREPHS